MCGDGLRIRTNYDGSASEGCDDNNTVPGDGCGADCQVEAGYRLLPTTTYYPLLTTHYLLPTTCYLLLTTYRSSPATPAWAVGCVV